MNDHTVGIDVGSITSKAVLMKDGIILASKVVFTGYNVETAARKVFEEVLGDVGLPPEAVGRIVATGYGRKGVSFAQESLTEILCHASGAYYQNP
ncbi:MAG: BadF/BadG/BcrA/BcrD ATPase family protein, partial [Syntrophus sp. (in: bacteria)]